jgi:hypothetical protein
VVEVVLVVVSQPRITRAGTVAAANRTDIRERFIRFIVRRV